MLNFSRNLSIQVPVYNVSILNKFISLIEASVFYPKEAQVDDVSAENEFWGMKTALKRQQHPPTPSCIIKMHNF